MPDPVASLQTARPEVFIGGQSQTALSQGLAWLDIVRSVEGSDVAEARFGNWGPRDGHTGYLYSDRALLDFGKEVTFKLGRNNATVLYSGRITALQGIYPAGAAPEIGVRAEDRLALLAGEPRTRVFRDVSDPEVVQQIVASHGLNAESDVLGLAYRVLAQTDQDDLTFLRARARAMDADLLLDGTTLRLRSRATRRSVAARLRYGVELREFLGSADLAEQCSSVFATGWDASEKVALREEATASSLGMGAQALPQGARLREQAVAARSLVFPIGATCAEEAKRAAATEYRRRGRRFLRGVGVADGAPGVRCGEEVELSGLGTTFDGVYRVVRVRHRFDLENGLRTEFEVESPAIGWGSSGGNPNAGRHGIPSNTGGRLIPKPGPRGRGSPE